MSFHRRPFAACCVASIVLANVAQATVETARPADSFVDSIGVNTHYINSVYTNQNGYSFTSLDQKLADLGIRHLRDNTAEDPTNTAGYGRLDSLYSNYGIRTTLVLGSTINSPQTLVNILKAHPAYEAIEGLNEPDFNTRSYGGFTDNPAANDYPATKAYQNDIFAAVKGDSQTAALKVFSPAMGGSSHSQYLAGSNFDFESLHSYPNARLPSTSLDTRINNVNAMSTPPKPIMLTETGYYNKPADGGQVSERAMGLYVPRMFAETFNRGIVRTYSYELVDENPTADKESNFGLLHWDLTPKPAYTALENLIDLVKEPSAAPFTPGSIDYTLTGAPSSVHHTLLQKSDGTYDLMLWNEVSDWDVTNQADLSPAPVSVTLALGTSFDQARIFLPNNGPDAIASYADPTSISLDVPDSVMVVELSNVPEPASTALLGTALAAIAASKSRRRRSSP